LTGESGRKVIPPELGLFSIHATSPLFPLFMHHHIPDAKIPHVLNPIRQSATLLRKAGWEIAGWLRVPLTGQSVLLSVAGADAQPDTPGALRRRRLAVAVSSALDLEL
jgi:hypothetical protein